MNPVLPEDSSLNFISPVKHFMCYTEQGIPIEKWWQFSFQIPPYQ